MLDKQRGSSKNHQGVGGFIPERVFFFHLLKNMERFICSRSMFVSLLKRFEFEP